MKHFPLGKIAYIHPDNISEPHFPDLDKPVNVIAYNPRSLTTNEVYLVERQVGADISVSERVFTNMDNIQIFVDMEAKDFRYLSETQRRFLEWVYPKEVTLIENAKEEKSKMAKMTLDNL